MQPEELYIPDPLMDVSAIRAAAGAPGAAAGAGGGGGGRPRRRGPPDLPSLLMDGRIVYLGMPVRIVLGDCFFPLPGSEAEIEGEKRGRNRNGEGIRS